MVKKEQEVGDIVVEEQEMWEVKVEEQEEEGEWRRRWMMRGKRRRWRRTLRRNRRGKRSRKHHKRSRMWRKSSLPFSPLSLSRSFNKGGMTSDKKPFGLFH